MVRTRVLHSDGHVQVTDTIAAARSPAPGATIWVDLVASTEVGLATLLPEWRFHPLALEDCLHEQRRSKYERYPGHDFLVLQALDRATTDELDTIPIRVLVKPGLVVTVRQRPSSALDHVAALFAEDTERVGQGSDRVVHALLDAIVDEFMPLLESWEAELDAIEDRMGARPEENPVEAIIAMRRRLLNVLRQMAPLQEVVRRLQDGTETTESGRIYYRDVHDHIVAVTDSAVLLKEVCDGLMRVQTERGNERLNKVMKYLAIVSTLMLPMTVISGVFGMNFDVIPTAHAEQGFWGALAMMLASALVLVLWFVRKGWL